MSDLVSALSPTTFTQIATVLFVATFLAVTLRALSRGQKPAQEAARALPLTDDDVPNRGALSLTDDDQFNCGADR